MTQYIDKSALVAEIEKLKAYLQIPNAQLETIKACDNIISVINTLEVKEIDEEIIMDKENTKEIDNRIERQYKEYISKLRDANRKAKDFEMTN